MALLETFYAVEEQIERFAIQQLRTRPHKRASVPMFKSWWAAERATMDDDPLVSWARRSRAEVVHKFAMNFGARTWCAPEEVPMPALPSPKITRVELRHDGLYWHQENPSHDEPIPILGSTFLSDGSDGLDLNLDHSSWPPSSPPIMEQGGALQVIVILPLMPNEHLGDSVEWASPLQKLQLLLAFYADLVQKAEDRVEGFDEPTD